MELQAAYRLLASEINPEVQHEVDKTLKMLRSKFPVAKKTKVVFERRVGATFDPWDWEIKIDQYGKNEPLSVVNREEDHGNATAISHGLAGTVIHEYGHAINSAIIQKIRHNDEYLDEWLQVKRDLEHKLGHPSGYSKKNNSEWFAEQFLHELLGHGHVLLDTIHEWSQRK